MRSRTGGTSKGGGISSAPRYVELRAHSAFSFGDGTATPEALAERAAELGYETVGLTDTADLGGIVRFVREARQRNVRPIVGIELVVDGHPMALLARTAEGYRHLATLVTRARAGQLGRWNREDGGRSAGAPDRGHPQVAWADVAEHSGGLHALTGPMSGRLATLLRAGHHGDARRTLARWRGIFGDRLAVEVQLHQVDRTEEALAGGLIELAESERVAWVVTNDPRYLDRGGRLAHDVLTALRAGCTLDEAAARGLLLPNGGWQLQSPEVMGALWERRPAGIEESARIAAECDFDLAWVRPPLPTFDIPEEYKGDTNAYLYDLVMQGAHERWGTLSDAQAYQLEHELKVIKQLGFAGFFLVIWDVVREARAKGILCQGRGSAANSAVAYCLGVTAVDPVRHGLLFERFLSVARTHGETEAPDVDLDLEHDRREEILDYAYGRWERDRAALTCIVQTYYAPNAVQDAMRAFGYPAELAARLADRVHRYNPRGGAHRLRTGLAAEHSLDVTSPRGRALLTAIVAFHNLPRLRSTHPGGFVLSSAKLGDYLPIEPTTMGRTIVQFDKDDLDTLGIPKFDFLGLGALSHVRRSFDIIEQYRGKRPSIYALDQNDEATFAMIAKGDTIGTFQIESRAQIASLVHTKPDRMYDIVVQVALVRPGPIQARFVRPYTRRRRGLEPVTYPHPDLEPILRRTQGIPIFQEQAMSIAMKLAGYTATEADELRRTMGHERKQPRLHAALGQLYQRMIAKKIAPDVARRIATDLRSFGNYGFPESHAWSFALVAYATAWLKAHHPAAFYAGILNAWPMGFYSPATLVHDAKRHGVDVRTPCLRRGDWDCTVEYVKAEHADGETPTALRIGWKFVRGVGERLKHALERARAEAPFAGIADAVHRAALTASDVSALARAGAFAAWEPDRRHAAWEALRAVHDTLPLAPTADAGTDDRYIPRPLDRHDAIRLDYVALGLSPAGHPMEKWRPWCRAVRAFDSQELAHQRNGERAIVAGLVVVRQQPGTANGTVFLLLEDELGVINVIVSPELVKRQEEIVRHATFVAAYGRVEREGDEISVVSERLEALTETDAVLARQSHDFR